MNDIKITVIGGDMRQGFLASELQNFGFTVSAYGVKGDCPNVCDTLSLALLGADFAVLPYPISPDGVYLNAICETCNIKLSELFEEIANANVKTVIGGGFKENTLRLLQEYGLKSYDYGNNESLKLKNALCTAEGAIEIAMRELPINVHSSKCTVLGYGRIGKVLAKTLKGMGAYVKVFARKDEALTLAEIDGMEPHCFSEISGEIAEQDVIFNTVPSRVLDKRLLRILKKDCLVIDLASAPGGVDFDEVQKLGLNVIWALSLPGKCSPKSAAMIICDTICEYLKTEGVY